MKKRILSFVLILVMALGLMPTIAFADTVTSGTCGENLIWTFEESTGTLTISGTGEMEDFGESWNSFHTSIKKVIINEGVTSIGMSAFAHNSNLESVQLPDSLISIDSLAFRNCINLELIIPDSVATIGSGAFNGCEKLQDSNGFVVVRDTVFDYYGHKNYITVYEDIKTIGYWAFAGCAAISITLPDSVTHIESGAFIGCVNLETIEFGKKIKYIGADTFISCDSLKTVYYGGTREDRDNIEMKYPDDNFINATWIYHEHKYDNACDTTCNSCDFVREITHSYGNYVSDGNATVDADGTKTRTCSVCGNKDTVADVGSKLPTPTPTPTPQPQPEPTPTPQPTPDPVPEIKDTASMFNDIKADSWYKEYVDYAVTFGIFNGTTDTTFAPSMTMTRAQFVQVLANISGVDTADKNVTTVFSDVPSGKWFTPAVKWANENGIVGGTGSGKFSPNNNITREDMCVMLVRFAAYKNLEIKATKEKTVFADDSKIGKWAVDAVYTCQMAEIVGGKGNNMFDPKATGSRSEAATIFTRFHKNYIV